MSSSSDLNAPALLIAMPQVVDPFFHKSVVLLLHLDDEGSFGFIVNRPTEIQIPDILKGMKISWEGRADELAYLGGPVQPQVGTILFESGATNLVQADGTSNASEALPGVGMTQHVNDLAKLAAQPPENFRLFLGYAGWGEGQLLDEILRNDWLVAPVTEELLFPSDPEETWELALASVGVDSSSLAAVSPGGNEQAN